MGVGCVALNWHAAPVSSGDGPQPQRRLLKAKFKGRLQLDQILKPASQIEIRTHRRNDRIDLHPPDDASFV